MQKYWLNFIVVVNFCLLLIGFATSYADEMFESYELLVESEILLVEVVDHISAGEFTQAVNKLKSILQDQPNFRLANLLYADLMAVRSGQLLTFGKGTKDESKIAQLLEEGKRRYQHSKLEVAHQSNMIPEALLQISSSQNRVVVIDSTLSRAHVFENGFNGLQLIDDYYATVGENGLVKTVEGDKRTPVGVYFITSRLNPLGLDDLYGDGALPLNYPNEWDQRLGRTGYGIWIHGVPSDTYSRPPFATEGCIALPNDDIKKLYNTPGIHNTPVIISSKVNWVKASSVNPLRRVLLKNIEQWRSEWVERNYEAHLAFYSNEFLADNADYQTLVHSKEKIETTLSVAISDISLFKYPENPDLVVATFMVTHWREKDETSLRIRQYWKNESGNTWRIVHEGPAIYKPVHFRGIPENLVPVMAKNN